MKNFWNVLWQRPGNRLLRSFLREKLLCEAELADSPSCNGLRIHRSPGTKTSLSLAPPSQWLKMVDFLELSPSWPRQDFSSGQSLFGTSPLAWANFAELHGVWDSPCPLLPSQFLFSKARPESCSQASSTYLNIVSPLHFPHPPI